MSLEELEERTKFTGIRIQCPNCLKIACDLKTTMEITVKILCPHCLETFYYKVVI